MRVTAIASLALAAVPTVLGAYSKGKMGFALGTKNPDGSCKDQSEYEKDFDSILEHTDAKIVRGYAASDCNAAQNILPAAKSKGFKVILGVWPDVEESFNADKKALTEWVPRFKDQVYGVTVGSETLYRGNFTGPELLEKIRDVEDALPGTLVGTADSWNKWADGTGDAVIKGGVKLILANAFAYWQGDNVGDGAVQTYFDDIQQALARIQKIKGSLDSFEFWNGETGWPTDGGDDYGKAKAGTENAHQYFEHAVCGLVNWGINTFYFEAFDEPWKPHSVGDSGQASDETKWGAMNADRSLKPNFSLKC